MPLTVSAQPSHTRQPPLTTLGGGWIFSILITLLKLSSLTEFSAVANALLEQKFILETLWKTTATIIQGLVIHATLF